MGRKLKPIIGTRDIDSVPPATYASPMPIAIEPAAVWMACMAEPQKRFTVAPATLRGRPARTPTIRPTFMPCSPSGNAQPIVTSSIWPGSRPERSTRARTTWPPSSSGRVVRSSPLCAGANGERT